MIQAGWTSAQIGTAYGSLTSPTDFGSAGGGAADGDPGTPGGGVVHLAVGGALAVNGTISANGASDSSTHGGCGSGGSILITANALHGTGTISASGGSGPDDCDGGAGGGGRIALYYTTTDFNFTNHVFARGGGPFDCPNRLWGGAGTIYFQSTTQSVGNLIVDNGGHVGAQTPITSPVTMNLVVSGGAAASASRGLTMNTLYLGTNSTLMDLPGDPSLDLLVLNGARLDPGSVISADATGYPLGANLGPGAPPAASDYGGGGGNGGPGGAGYGGAPGGGTYGFLAQPVDLGSAGGTADGDPGTPGGGAIRLTVLGPLVHHGTISANGGSDPESNGGCGSGGSIWLTAGSLSGSGRISAAGGTGHSSCDGGSGGGGRIAIYSGNLSGFNTATQVSAPSGGPSSCPDLLGGTGSVYTAGMANLPTLAVLSSTPNGGSPRPWVDCLDVVFNMALDPASFRPHVVTLTTPAGLLSESLLTVTNLGGTRWRMSFPRQTANGSYQYTVGPQITNLFGARMTGVYTGGFTVNQSAAANRITWNTQGANAQLSVLSVSGFSYQLLRSDDLANWEALSPVTPGDGSVFSWSVTTTDTPQAFFRIQIIDAP